MKSNGIDYYELGYYFTFGQVLFEWVFCLLDLNSTSGSLCMM